MKPPLFILAPPRSFTSVTCAMIGNHPQMIGLAETNLFTFDTLTKLARLWRRQPRMQHGLLRSIAELGLGGQSATNVDAAKAWLKDRMDMRPVDLFEILAEWAGDRGLVEKSPAHVYSPRALERMHEHFPDAFYLHLTRHPVTTWRSMVEVRAMQEKTLERIDGYVERSNLEQGQEAKSPAMARDLDIDRAWLQPHLGIVEFLEIIPADKRIRLRGEDLLNDPPTHLRRLSEWLGLGADPAAIESMSRPERSPFAGYGPANARFGNDPSFLANPALRPFRSDTRGLDDYETEAGERVVLSDELKACARMFSY